MVSVIGASNIDITACPDAAYRPGDSNPGKVHVSFGGVGRNIAHDLRLLGVPVRFFTAFGGDAYASSLRQSCEALGMDLSCALTCLEETSSIYIGIHDENGELAAGVSDMNLVRRISKDYIMKHLPMLAQSEAVFFDTNLEEETIAAIASSCPSPLYVDTVSCRKAEKLKRVLERGGGRLFTLKANLAEAQTLSGSVIHNEADLHTAAKRLHAWGVERVYITLGKDGVYVSDGQTAKTLPSLATKVVNATGAGDAFLSAVILAGLSGGSAEDAAKMGLKAARLTLESENAVGALSAEAVMIK